MRRSFGQLAAVAIVLGLTATGCTGTSPSSPTDTAQPTATSAVPAPAPNLQVPILTSTALVQNFNPFAPANQIYARGTVYEPLYVVDKSEGGKEIPWLATDYAWSDDLLTLTFTLRDGVTWSDGEAFTADDVVYTYELGKSDPGLDASGFWSTLGGTGVTANGNQVSFTFATADVSRFPQFANTSYIVPEHVLSAQSDIANWQNLEPVGTGPFTEVANFSPQSYSLLKNPHYWNPDVVVPGLDYTQYASQDAIIQALKTDKADWAGVVIPDIEKTYVAADPEHNQFNYAANTSSLMLCVNSTVEPLDDPAFRRAMSQAIDRTAIQNNAVYGYALPSTASGIGGQFPDLDITVAKPELNKVVTHDIDAAKQTLTEAGYTWDGDKLLDKSGKQVTVTLPVVSSWTDWVSTAQIIADGFKALGIDASVDPQPDFGVWYDLLQKGNFTVSECGGGLFDSPELYYYSMFSSDLTTPVGEAAPQNSFGRWSDPELDKAIAALRLETDPAKRTELYTTMQTIFIDNLPNIPLNFAPYWQVFTTHNYTGWPTAEDNYATGLNTNDYNQLLVFAKLRPVQ